MADIFHNLQIEHRPISDLHPYLDNARTHSKKQLHQIAASIDQFGFTNPILIDANDRIMAGHGRVEAAKLLGIETVPTIRLNHLTSAQTRAYSLADNRLAELAGWDEGILATELQFLNSMELEFDLEITGFETAEIDLKIESLMTSEAIEDSEINFEGPDRSSPAVSTLGDLWPLGDHRLLCGDALESECYERLLGEEKAQMVFADSPYNVPISGHVGGKGKFKHEEFAMACGEMDETEFIAFLQAAFGHMADFSVDGSLHYLCMDWKHVYEMMSAGRVVYDDFKNLCVWNKANGGMGSLYRSKHELVFVFKHGTAKHINNVELGRFGRNRTNVWDYVGANSFSATRDTDLAMHPTVKPVGLVADAIRDASRRGGIILDPFAGSGSTILAAEKTGRRARVMELDPHYVDVMLKRFRDLTGLEPVHVQSGLTFGELS